MEAIRDSALNLSTEWRQHLEKTKKRNLALIETIAGLTGAHVVVDSSKIGLRLKYLLKIASLDIRVVRLIRDGRGVALTYVNPGEFADARSEEQREGGSGSTPRWRKRQGLPMEDAAREWRRSNEEADAILAGLPRSQWLEVRYEDLCADTSGTLRIVSSFLGVDPDRTLLDFRAREHHVVGNGMRFDSTSEVRLDDRWKTELNPSQLEAFELVAGDLNRRYGYR